MDANAPQIQSNVKDESLVEKRRQQILRASIHLFREKGFHKATTREIAKLAGFSSGTLYEYVRTKEDVLFLICDRIFQQVTEVFIPFTGKEASIRQLETAIIEYFKVVDRMKDEFTIMYQETKSLPKQAVNYVIEKEIEMVGFFIQLIERCVAKGELALTKSQIHFVANEILVVGQSWAFRKWALQEHFSLEEFTNHQLKLIMNGLKS